MSFLNSALMFLKVRDCDKSVNLPPNDAYNIAVLPSLTAPGPKPATQAS